MREIKFRAWVFKEEKMVQHLNRAPAIKMFTPDYAYTNKEVAVMQYTGLKDKNGTEVYEGDILRFPHLKGYVGSKKEVFFDERGFFTTEEYDFYEIFEKEYTIEVIGNIHEHPHLLERD